MFEPTHDEIISLIKSSGRTYDQARRKILRDNLDEAIMSIEDADKQPKLRALLQFMAEKICDQAR